jgi:hypothetical protein
MLLAAAISPSALYCSLQQEEKKIMRRAGYWQHGFKKTEERKE